MHTYMYLTRILWPRRSQRSGEVDAVEGIALAIREVGGKGRQLATCALSPEREMQNKKFLI